MNDEKKYHWYSMAFSWPCATGRAEASGQIYLLKQRVTSKNIAEAKEGLTAPATATVLSISYLGHMTISEFNDE